MNKKITVYEILCTYDCPNTGEKITVGLDEYCFKAWSGECELCGSHGDIKIELPRCSCGKIHEIVAKEW